MGLVSVFLLGALLAGSTPPFMETYGPQGKNKTINGGYVSCVGRTLVQTENALEDLIRTDNNREAAYALRLNKCSFVAEKGAAQRILKVHDQRCVNPIRTPSSHYCKFEYYLFELQDPQGKRSFAIYAPMYD